MQTSTARRMSVEDRREQLLAFGRSYFADHAFDAMSMDEIAELAGVSKALLYHYFGGRRGFYVATIEHVADQIIEVTNPPAGVPFDHAFEQMLSAFVRFVRENGPIARALVRGGLGADREASAILDRVRSTSVERILDRLGIASPSPLTTVALHGWIAFAENAAVQALDTAEVDEAELVQLLVRAFGPVLQTFDCHA